ncbi:RDD family protein [Methylobacter sp. G7]|uniref:RDD family protein n=1 Tax=Methylobacter sp. G7 TaxID=3230117 RepID=UPI003D805641
MAVSTKSTQQKSGNYLIAKPGFLRRLAAMFYDLLLLIAVLFVATALLLPLNSGQAFTAQQFLFPLYLLLVSFFFYAWFWTHGGQTLGLRAWKIKVLTLDRKPLTWKQALLRFSIAILSWGFLGLGVLWILIDKNQRSWHDHLSKTALFFDTHDSDH